MVSNNNIYILFKNLQVRTCVPCVCLQARLLGASAISHFHVILTGQSISEIILIMQGHLQDQKVNFKVIWEKNVLFNK